MFEYLYDWMKNIAYFMILATTVIHLLPDYDYRRYIRLFMGMVLVVLLAAPVFQLFDRKEALEQIFDSRVYQEQMESIEDAASFLYEIREEDYLDSITEDP